MARVVRNGLETEIPANEVVVNDILIVKPGEKIPTDAVVVEGSSAVDEKMITGESIPADKKPEDEVIVHSGEIIPRDGLVNEGKAFVDESMMTGEFTPIFLNERNIRIAQEVATIARELGRTPS